MRAWHQLANEKPVALIRAMSSAQSITSATTRVVDGDHCDVSISYLPSQAPHSADPVLALCNLLARPTIDPPTLARAIEKVAVGPNLDRRTLQLVKEGWVALERSTSEHSSRFR